MSIAVDNSLAAFVLAALVDPTKPALVPVKPPTMLRWALDKVVKVVAWAVSTNPTNIEFVGSDQKTTDEAKKYLEIDLNCEEWKFTYNDKKAVGVTLKIYTSDEFEAAQKKQSGTIYLLNSYLTNLFQVIEQFLVFIKLHLLLHQNSGRYWCYLEL